MATKTCPHCGKEFEIPTDPSHAQKTYCTGRHKRAAHRKRRIKKKKAAAILVLENSA